MNEVLLREKKAWRGWKELKPGGKSRGKGGGEKALFTAHWDRTSHHWQQDSLLPFVFFLYNLDTSFQFTFSLQVPKLPGFINKKND